MEKELINTNIVLFDVDVTEKEEVIGLIADAMDKDGRLIDKKGYVEDVLKREATSSTAIGFSTATPHAKSVSVKSPSLAFVRLKQPMKWDDEEITMLFQIAVPSPGQGDRHMEILAQLFRNLVYDEFRDKLSAASSEQEVVDILKEF
ncbi:MAG: PTS sugar transporter subunit IIA [Anaerostipes sp.]|jgi:fructose-specific phosphotransferase system IIA component|nr:PTS sugar transporter subunit IIA [Anaerostipes sp.]MDD3747682.1 PTS sugar transporter subunit IIA [Anaerostipes sp.]